MDSESNILLKIINESKIVNFEIINKNKSKCIEEFHNSKDSRHYNTRQFCIFDSIKLTFRDYGFNYLTINSIKYLYINLPNKTIFIELLDDNQENEIFNEKIKKQEKDHIVILIQFNLTDKIKSCWDNDRLICKVKQSKVIPWKDSLDKLHSIIKFWISSEETE